MRSQNSYIEALQELATVESLAALSETASQIASVIYHTPGTVWITGLGTSLCVAERLSHLLSCLGAASAVLVPSLGLHGGLGSLGTGDLVVAFSKSGTKPDLIKVTNSAALLGARVLLVTSNSALSGQMGAYIVNTGDSDLEGVVATFTSTVLGVLSDLICNEYAVLAGFDRIRFRHCHPD